MCYVSLAELRVEICPQMMTNALFHIRKFYIPVTNRGSTYRPACGTGRIDGILSEGRQMPTFSILVDDMRMSQLSPRKIQFFTSSGRSLAALAVT